MSEPEVVQAFGAIAQSYARLGLRVFPLAPRSKVPLTPRGFKDATDDVDQVRRWWAERPDANIGIACGESSGLFVVDVDGPAGEAALAWLEADWGSLPVTAEVRTGKGRHLYFRHFPGSRNTASYLGEHIDTRGEGGYVVAPPSIHPDGGVYAWAERRGPRDIRRADAPEWLCKRLEKKESAPATASTWKPTDERTSKRARAFCLGALRREHDEVARAGEGTRNPRLSQAAYALGGYVSTGFLDENEIREALRSAASACGLWADDGATRCLDTIDRGIEAGIAAPRPLPEERPQEATRYTSDPAYESGVTPPTVGAPLPPPTHWLEEAFKPVGEQGVDWLDVEPPPQRWFLTRDDGVPACPSGIVGMLVAPGGRGKSMALIDLAICIATGRKWMDVFTVSTPGPVAVILAEEAEAEVRRRLFRLVRALNLNPEERELVRQRVILLGMHGKSVALSDVSNDTTTPTEMHTVLSRLVRERQCDVILDPLVRFIPGSESDNVLANQAILLLEQLAEAEGRTVIVAHHTAKVARRDGNQGDTSDARGVSGLTDSARWVANIAGKGEGDIKFKITKCNGIPAAGCDPVDLVRDPASGRLHAPSSLDRDLARAHAASMDEERRRVVAAAIADAIASNPDCGKRDLRDAFRASGHAVAWQTFDAILEELVEEGHVKRTVRGQRHSYRIEGAV